MQTNTSISKTLTTPNAGEDVEQALSLIADENAKGYSHFGDSLAISYKAKHIFPCNLLVIGLGIYLNENGSTQKQHTDIINSFIHNCQNMEAAVMSLNNILMNKHTVVHPFKNILYSNKCKYVIKPQKKT